MTVGELLDRIDGGEVVEWEEYMKLAAWRRKHGALPAYIEGDE